MRRLRNWCFIALVFAAIPAHAKNGKASWYGHQHAGRLTANGEHFNPKALTAAHRKLPFGTIVRVTNKDNHKSVIVRINDRGPYVGGRIIDLTEAAAKRIDLKEKGIGEVKVAILKMGKD